MKKMKKNTEDMYKQYKKKCNKITIGGMEKMKKENKKKKWYIALLLLLVIGFAIITGNAFSKYLMEVKGKGIVEVANWSFLVNGQTSSINNIQLAQTYTPETLVENTIAPRK